MEKNRNILLIDDEEGLRFGLKTFLTRQGFGVYEGASRADAKKILSTVPIDIAILDIRLKAGESGLDLIEALKEKNPDTIILIVTGYAHLETAIEAIRKGANDYLEKPLENRRVLDSIYKNLELSNLRKENALLRRELKSNSAPVQIIAESAAMKSILQLADRVKDLAPNILITGESGTGKEILARYIHNTGARKDGLFVGLNSAALSDSLLLSELFGHCKGAFTGAIENKTGKLELAHKGTFFLDEIGDMNLDIQAKFLRVLEERSFEPLGSNKTIQVDIHIIAATNKNLQELITQQKFREDILYRLKVINFHLPPLRERLEDIRSLADSFIEIYSRLYRKPIEPVTDSVLDVLIAHRWPGNIRELKNVINQAVILAEGPCIEASIIRNLIGTAPAVSGIEKHSAIDVTIPGLLSKGTLSERIAPVVEFYEKQLLYETLNKYNQNKTKAAEELGVTRKTITRKLQSYES